MNEALFFNPSTEIGGGGSYYPTTIGMFHGGIINFVSGVVSRFTSNLTTLSVISSSMVLRAYVHAGARIDDRALFYGGRNDEDEIVGSSGFFNYDGALVTLLTLPSAQSPCAATVGERAFFYGSNGGALQNTTLMTVTKTGSSNTSLTLGLPRRASISAVTIDDLMVMYGAGNDYIAARRAVSVSANLVMTLSNEQIGTGRGGMAAAGVFENGSVGLFVGGLNQTGQVGRLTTKINSALTEVSSETNITVETQTGTVAASVAGVGVFQTYVSLSGTNTRFTLTANLNVTHINTNIAQPHRLGAGCGL